MTTKEELRQYIIEKSRAHRAVTLSSRIKSLRKPASTFKRKAVQKLSLTKRKKLGTMKDIKKELIRSKRKAMAQRSAQLRAERAK